MIPAGVLSERGNAPLTAEVLAQSLAECGHAADDTPSPTEVRGRVLHLGGGDSWNECLRAGMPVPATMRELCRWLLDAGWLEPGQVPDVYR